MTAAGDPTRRPVLAQWSDAWRSPFTRRHIVPGTIGSALIAIGAVGVGYLPPLYKTASLPVVGLLRSDIGSWGARAAVVIGGAVLLQSWLVLGIDVLRGIERDVRHLWAALVAWCLPVLLVPPLFSRDVYSYFVQGKLVLNQADPYGGNGVATVPGWFVDGVDPLWAITPTPYGPLWLSLARGVASLAGDNTYLAVIAFRGLSLVGVALLAIYVPRLAFHLGLPVAKSLWLGVLNPLTILLFVVSIHNDALMMGLIVLGLVLVIERRPSAAVLAVTAAIAIKPVAIIALPFIGLIWAGRNSDLRQRIVRWAMTTGLATGVFVALTLVVGGGFGWIRALSTPGTVTTWLSLPTAIGMTIAKVGELVGVDNLADPAIAVSRLIGLGVAAVVIGWLCLRPEGRTPVKGLTIAMTTIVVLGPTFQTWYVLWVIPIAAVAGLAGRGLRAAMLVVAGTTIYALCETSATADNNFGISDGVMIVLTVMAIATALWASRGQRALVFGEPTRAGILPADRPSQARHDTLVMTPAGIR